MAAAAPAPAVKALSCPSCGGTIAIRAAGYSVTIVCQYCASILDAAQPEVRLVAEHHKETMALEIPLGTRGSIGGVEWEAIGYVRRSENGAYPWDEYLLFNPYHGYRWLVGDGRGWSFGEMLTRMPVWGSDTLVVDGEPYKPFFADARAQVDYVLGEFYWRVATGEEVVTASWVRPGWMLSREANGSEISWTLLRLLGPDEVSGAFGVAKPPRPWPPLPHQPSPHRGTLVTLTKLGLATIALLVMLMIAFGGSDTLLAGRMTLPQTGETRTASFGPVTLSRPYQAVTIQARAPDLSNAWADLDFALVDRRTQVAYQAYGLAERYSGRDSDGNWSEGNRTATVKMAAVPAGTYDLVVDASASRWTGAARASGRSGEAEPPSTAPIDVALTLRAGATFASNLVLAFFLILIPVLVIAIRHANFEQARVGESDFAPTGEDEEDDEE